MDPYETPTAENRSGNRYNHSTAIAPKGKEGTVIGVHNVDGDLDAILDLQDESVHYPVHRTVIMPRLAARTVDPWAEVEQCKYLAS